MKYFVDLRDDDSVLPGAVELVDLSHIGYFNVDFQGASAMPHGYQTAQEVKQIRATILFGMNALNEGLANLIQAHFVQTMPDHPFRLARSESQARSMAEEIHRQFEEGAC